MIALKRLEKQNWYIVGGLFLFAVVVRLIVWIKTEESYLGDMIFYVDMAKSIGSGDLLYAIKTVSQPLYPFLIYMTSLLFQDYDLSARWVSLFFGSLLVYPIFRIAHLIYGRWVAALTGLFLSLADLLITSSLSGYAESTYIFFITMAFYKSVQALQSRSHFHMFWSGCFFGLAFLTKGQAVVFFTLTLFWMVVTRLTDERKINYKIVQGVVLFTLAYILFASPYVILLHQKTGQWMFNPKNTETAKKNFQYGFNQTIINYKLQLDDKGNYFTLADVKFAEKKIYLDGKKSSVNRQDMFSSLKQYVKQVVSRFFGNLPGYANSLFPFASLFFVIALIKREWNVRIEGYLLFMILCNFLVTCIFTWNPRHLSTAMPLTILFGTCGIVRAGHFIGRFFAYFIQRFRKDSSESEGKLWVLLLSIGVFLGSVIVLLNKKPNEASIARSNHQKIVAQNLRGTYGTSLKIMSWGLGRSAIPHYMEVKQSQVRTIPMAPLDEVVRYARQEGVTLLIFDTEEINPRRFPGIDELLRKRGLIYQGLKPVLISPRGKSAIVVYQVL